ncbi:outer membrane protein OmpK [uncultured Ferrimonas sp.]|uniref:outer membrane protein OmpK n=1 Tax=uncultured Ferrimonas sp. TaxID=432640 RepID=UPI00261C287B|nr:outer membrane protein OmpK [uncultured Ferrimonas sp.]
MKAMRSGLLSMLLCGALVTPAHSADYVWGFADMNVNWLDWTSDTEVDSGGFKEDFYYLEIEGGAGFDWGDVYMFFDMENTFEGNDSQTAEDGSQFQGNGSFRIAAKISGGYNIYNSWQLYAQSYYAIGNGFYDSTNVFGLRYGIFTDYGFWMKPFLGLNYTRTQDWTGVNGGILGWVFGYDFTMGEQRFSISNWHETEFSRDDGYGGSGSERESLGHNGALAFWWHLPNSPLTTGIQYRYFENKLGQDGYGDAIIYSLKYNF